MALSTRDMVAGGSSPMRDISRFLSMVRICSSRMADLFEQDDGVLCKAEGVGELDVRRQPRLVDAARDGGGDDGGGVTVARVVLHDEHGPHAPLFAAHHGRKIGIVKFTAFYVHHGVPLLRRTSCYHCM